MTCRHSKPRCKRIIWQQIQIIGHRMKGDGGGYGFDAISVMGAALEQAAAREDRDAIRRHTAELINFLACVKVIYRK